MGIHLPGALREAQAFIGLPFPATDEAALRGRAQDWQQLAQHAAQTLARIDQAATAVGAENEGDAVREFQTFMSSGGGNVGSLRDFQRACQAAALAHGIAAAGIAALKMFTIAQLGVVQSVLTVAKAVPQAVPVAMQVRQQAFVAIQQATMQAATQLRAG
ncbi:hypothetical protein [uncultured Tessaracoccus sp.]|uniref:hypothetical protein n=1 Tax=uncultured Tessaracoccus sp. TaxID=905023 RepID=UPI0025D4A178|nr:hypothetical protein [uncultured Tessaracoccus sp.]